MSERAGNLITPAALLVALALFVAVAFVVGSRPGRDMARSHSSESKNPWGTAGGREWIQRLGVPTRSWERPLTELDESVSMLVVLDPHIRMEEDEQDRLLKWVADGGRLVLGVFGDAGEPLEELLSGRVSIGGYIGMGELLGRLGLALSDQGDDGRPGRVKTRSSLTDNVQIVSVPSRYRLVEATGDEVVREQVPHGPPRVD
ncbi:MAG: DUF4350 domain-containing protein, partial [Armatimonadetes bacterium]|nr:DUF4350 domain-containing protein [Armatimonadota bacterium]